MRIALLLSGQPRFVKEVAPIILANVIGDYNVDTFCHFWFDDKLQSEPYKYGECNKGEWHKQRISADAIDEAIEAGKKAFKRGMKCAVPPQYVGCDIQFAAWKLGWSQAATAKT